MRDVVLSVIGVLMLASTASANPRASSFDLFSTAPLESPWQGSWWSGVEMSAPKSAPAPRPQFLVLPTASLQDQQPPALHAAAVEHSDGYQTRAKIHKYASFATLPLFAAEVALGQSLYNGSGESDSKRGAHAAIGAGIVGLFGVNTVTGAWNLFGEGRRDPEGRTLRLVHGLLMMAADVGFMATWAAAPGHEGDRGGSFQSDKSTHRNLAIASISTGTAGYLLMLFGNH
jgi:hypothetical protein